MINLATFTNQAQLTYNNTVTVSNLAVGEIQDVLSINKTAVTDVYTGDDTITYAINIINSGSTELSGLTLTDDLGLYPFSTTSLMPLTYVPNTVRHFRNNIPQTPPTVSVSENGLVITGFTVPANGSVTFLYKTVTNEFTPLEPESSITNTAELSGNFTSVKAEETTKVSSEPVLSIVKSISPIPVTENGTVTYTFVIENSGNSAVTAGAVITDVFNPILSNITASFNNTPWTQGVDYSYNTATGLFTTAQDKVTVDAAVYTQDQETGAITITPGTSTLTVTGTI